MVRCQSFKLRGTFPNTFSSFLSEVRGKNVTGLEDKKILFKRHNSAAERAKPKPARNRQAFH